MANPNEEVALQRWLRQFNEGLSRGMAPSPEDRRETLTAIRELEGKAEGPRYLYTLYQNPILDLVRQRNTFQDVQGIQSLGLPQLTDDAILYRANKGLIAGPTPEEVIPKEMWKDNQALPADPIKQPGESDSAYERRTKPYRDVRETNLDIYKQKLNNIPFLTKAGAGLGSALVDASQDVSRGLWWLINASQATVNLASEGIAAAANPDLFGARPLTDLEAAEKQGLLRYVKPNKSQLEEMITEPIPDISGSDPIIQEFQKDTIDSLVKAEKASRLDARNYVARAPGVKNVRGGFKQRRFNPNLVNVATMLPAAIGINAGIGLLGGEDSGTILPGTGRKEGYTATVKSEEDPRKTVNPLLEAGSKYFLGREGNLLAWNEGFSNERPDVSRQEYNQYKGYERDRSIDLNPFDGDFNLGGVLKGTMEGIHGPEVQFLGKNVSLTESGIPVLGAMLGGAIGTALPNVTRFRKRKNNPKLRQYVPENYYQKDSAGKLIRDEAGSRVLKDEYQWEAPDLKVDKYRDPNASRFTKLMGELPEVAPRDPSTGEVVRSEVLGENKTLRKVEDFFYRKPETDASGKVIVGPEEHHRGKVLSTALGAGIGGLIGGSVLGSTIEDERRKRNFESNNPGIDYKIFKENAERIGERQLELSLENPNRKAEREESRSGFNSRAYQQSLGEENQRQAAMIDEIGNKYLQGKAREKLGENTTRLEKIQQIEREIYENKYGEDAVYPY